jgi:hypothetical protein
MIASDIINRVRDVANDPINGSDGVRWLNAELMLYISDGQEFIVNKRPDASAQDVVVTLVAGTKQALPAGSIFLLDVYRNITGGAPGRVVRYIDRDMLDQQNPNWHSATNNGFIQHVMYDERVPLQFFTYPPATAGQQIEISAAEQPTDVVNLTDSLTIATAYREALLSYTLMRCFMKDTEANGMQKAMMHMQALSNALGIKLVSDQAQSPDLTNRGANPHAGALAKGAP